MKRKLITTLCLLTLILVTGCQLSKKALTTDEFNNITSNNGLTPVDVKDQFQKYNVIKEATIAVKQNEWQIEYYVLTDKENAKKMFNKNKNGFEKEYTSSKLNNNIEIGNYNKYTLETKEVYISLTRVDNTFLYADVPIKNKDEVVKLIKDLKY